MACNRKKRITICFTWLTIFKYGKRFTVFLKKSQVKVKEEMYDLIVKTSGEKMKNDKTDD